MMMIISLQFLSDFEKNSLLKKKKSFAIVSKKRVNDEYLDEIHRYSDNRGSDLKFFSLLLDYSSIRLGFSYIKPAH